MWITLREFAQTSSANLLVPFDLPAPGKSTGNGEMSPKHQHWNSFSGKALGWLFFAKIWVPLHPWYAGTRLGVTEGETWEASELIPGSSAAVFHCSSFPNDPPSSWRGHKSSASPCAAPVLFAIQGGGRQGAQKTAANSRITFQQDLPYRITFHVFQGVYCKTTLAPFLTMFM